MFYQPYDSHDQQEDSLSVEFRKKLASLYAQNEVLQILGRDQLKLNSKDAMEEMIRQFTAQMNASITHPQTKGHGRQFVGKYEKEIYADPQLIALFEQKLDTIKNDIDNEKINENRKKWVTLSKLLDEMKNDELSIEEQKIKIAPIIEQYNLETNRDFNRLSLYDKKIKSYLSDLRCNSQTQAQFEMLVECDYNLLESDIVEAALIIGRGDVNYQFASKMHDMGFNFDWLIPMDSTFRDSEEQVFHYPFFDIFKKGKTITPSECNDWAKLLVANSRILDKKFIEHYCKVNSQGNGQPRLKVTEPLFEAITIMKNQKELEAQIKTPKIKIDDSSKALKI